MTNDINAAIGRHGSVEYGRVLVIWVLLGKNMGYTSAGMMDECLVLRYTAW